MNNIVIEVENLVKKNCEEYKHNSSDKYDFWNEHIKYVYKEAEKLANKYNADMEIVKLGALLHDIALIRCVGDRKDHHINGKIIADEILTKYGYPNDKKERVLGCVFNHRSSHNANNNEELCVCDADILAHFDNIPMLFYSAYERNKVSLNDARTWIKECFSKDYNDLSDRTKEEFKNNYENILNTILVDYEG